MRKQTSLRSFFFIKLLYTDKNVKFEHLCFIKIFNIKTLESQVDLDIHRTIVIITESTLIRDSTFSTSLLK